MSRVVRVGRRSIGEGNPCYIIAEAGSNHDGDFDQAIRLIDVAAAAGADAVKFQLFHADAIAADTSAPIASLEGGEFEKFGGTLHELYRRLELPREWLGDLKARAERRQIEFCATPFDEDAVDELERLGVPFYKIASFEVVHLPLIRHAARTGRPLILSTAMATLEEIGEAVRAAEGEGDHDLVLLHCGIEYPLAYEHVNLRAMRTVADAFPYPVGYSDHTLGETVPVAAVALGASVLEKHFTLSRALEGPDHAFALEPDELASMVRVVRDAETSLGDPHKGPLASEAVHLARGRRSVFAMRAIARGEPLALDALAVLRPAAGLAPRYLDEIVGRRAAKDLEAGDPITWDALEGREP